MKTLVTAAGPSTVTDRDRGGEKAAANAAPISTYRSHVSLIKQIPEVQNHILAKRVALCAQQKYIEIHS